MCFKWNFEFISKHLSEGMRKVRFRIRNHSIALVPPPEYRKAQLPAPQRKWKAGSWLLPRVFVEELSLSGLPPLFYPIPCSPVPVWVASRSIDGFITEKSLNSKGFKGTDKATFTTAHTFSGIYYKVNFFVFVLMRVHNHIFGCNGNTGILTPLVLLLSHIDKQRIWKDRDPFLMSGVSLNVERDFSLRFCLFLWFFPMNT